MPIPLNVLVLEDRPDDAILMLRELRRSGFDLQSRVVESQQEFLDALNSPPDLVLADYSLPQFDAPMALQQMQERNLDIPFIIVSGTIGEELAVAAMRQGASDYLLKDRMARLGQAVRHAMEQKAAEHALKATEQRYRALAARLQSVREAERASIAREIHDELGQRLTSMKMDLSFVARRMPTGAPQAEERLRDVLQTIDDTARLVQRIAWELRPSILDDLGLLTAIEWQAREFERRYELPCHLRMALDDSRLDADRGTALFRIFQEALTNVARHAHATRVEAFLEQSENNVFLEVRDNGRGLDPDAGGDPNSLGLLGMRERASVFGGMVTVSGEPGQGTTVMACIPLASELTSESAAVEEIPLPEAPETLAPERRELVEQAIR